VADREALTRESYPKLSDPQIDLLAWLRDATYQQGTFRGADLRTARALERRGIVESVGYGSGRTFGLTDFGRRAADRIGRNP
jgi:hypothetical protein